MPLLNSKTVKSQGGKRDTAKIKNPEFPASVIFVFCDNSEYHGSIPKSGERMKGEETCGRLEKNMVGLEANTGVPKKTLISARLQTWIEAEPRVT